MRIRVAFSVDVPDTDALKELTQTDNLGEARKFVVDEAAEYINTYLNDNGVPATLRGLPWLEK